MRLHLDLPERAQVDALLTARHPASVSIYLATDPASDGQAERIELRNLADEALRQLREAGYDKREVQALEELLQEVQEDAALWAYLARSLAVFATPERLATFRLPNELTSAVEVADRFHVKPLLRALTFPQSAYVLALSQNAVRFLEVLPDGPPEAVEVPDLPQSAVDAVAVPSISGRKPHGRVQGGEGVKMRLGQYSRAVDQALRPVLAGQTVPLVLAAARPLDDIYRQWNTYPHLAAETIGGNPETLSDGELAAAARSVIDGVNAAALAEVRDLFDRRAGEGRAVADLADVARAATYGMVDTVFVDIDALVPGTIDETSGAIDLSDEGGADRYGVLDEVARRVWLAGGRVLAVRRSDIPRDADAAAILRWAL